MKNKHARVLLSFLFMIFVGLFAKPASAEETLEVFKTLPDQKSLLANPQFLVVDDFNEGKFKVRQGATWRIKEPVVGALEVSLDKQDGRNPKRGYSLKARFNLQPKETVSTLTFLDKLDVSQAEYFVLKARLKTDDDKPFTGRFRLTLQDWRHKTIVRDITPYFPESNMGWREIIIPMKEFKSLDLDQLTTLHLSIIAKKEPLKGNFWIDEIAFFGFNNTFFESHRDNMVGFPKVIYDKKRMERLKGESSDDVFLKAIAFDTWKYFINAKEKNTALISDHIRMGAEPLIADYTSPTNIAMDLLAIISAWDFGFIDKKEAESRTLAVFETLEKMPRYDDFFYNFYDIKKLSIGRPYISSVDSGWLGLAFVVVRQAFDGAIADKATKFLDEFDFNIFMDPENNHMVVGLDVPVRNFGQYHYGMLMTEARATSLLAIGKGDISRDHWWFLYRTLPDVWSWQNQEPKGGYVMREGHEVFHGYYESHGKKFIPTWGGSVFELLMPTLLLKEAKLSPNAYGHNNRVTMELHQAIAKEKGYDVWGMSPCAISSGKKWTYREYGSTPLGSKGYPDRSVITPHASFLALDATPAAAINNIRALLKYDIYGEYGFYDAINLKNKRVNTQYLALDQGMILVALNNYLNQGAIQERFHADEIGKNIEDLLVKESFFNT